MADVPKQQITEPCSSCCEKDIIDDFEDEMSEEDLNKLTNGLVCEFYNKFKDLTWDEVVIKFKEEFCVSKDDCEVKAMIVFTQRLK